LPADEFADACARGAQLSIDQAAAMTNDALADVEQLSARAYSSLPVQRGHAGRRPRMAS
jgi:hypothetical protein